MSKIHLLPSNIISLIAAGEVVERPSSVVKELVENSIDAGATMVKIDFIEGGKESLTVIDNGSGIDPKDAELLLTLHATSKILTAKDLENITSLGFRGEALASIASVSQISVTSKTELSAGFKLDSVFGKQTIQSSEQPTTGTKIVVNNLFQNTPARLKFLKTTATEQASITDTFLSIALANPSIHLELSSNGKNLYLLPKAVSILDRAHDIWGKNVTNSLWEANFVSGEININGYIGKPELARSDHKMQFILVNGRRVSDRTIARAVTQAYSGFIHRNLQPVYILNIQIPANLVDTNVHPRKLEVRFSTPQQVFSAVFNSVQQALKVNAKADISQRIATAEQPEPIKSLNHNFIPTYGKSVGVKAALNFSQLLLSDLPKQSYAAAPAKPQQLIEFHNPVAKPLQVFNTYIIYEHNNEVVFVDQHAAAEKIAYEKIIKNINLKSSKALLIPEVLDFPLEDKEYLIVNSQKLNNLGIQISDLGTTTIQVSSLPADFKDFNIRKYLEECIQNKSLDFKFSDPSQNLEQVNLKMHLSIASLACHSSIRAGQPLNNLEMVQILNDLADCDTPYNCPHGRPVSWVLTKSELERSFKRVM